MEYIKNELRNFSNQWNIILKLNWRDDDGEKKNALATKTSIRVHCEMYERIWKVFLLVMKIPLHSTSINLNWVMLHDKSKSKLYFPLDWNRKVFFFVVDVAALL